MKNKVFLIITFFTTMFMKAQHVDDGIWVLMENEPTTTLSFTKSDNLSVGELLFQAIWDNELSYSDNIGYYGGISELKVFKNKKHLQTLKNIEDGIALGNINFEVYDYNMDGYLDFTVPIDCGRSCYHAYYLYNPKTKKFEHRKEWDYLRIQQINRKKRQIISQPDGMRDNRKTYQVKGLKLIEVEN